MEGFLDFDLLLKLALAIFFGSTVGMERYIHGRPAGLRTYLLVCVAFASIAILSQKYWLMGGPLSTSGFRPDPGRLIAGGLTGIGFLGAGIIIRGGVTVHGLTTAAGIWAISVVGLSVGSGYYFLGSTLYLITLFSLFGLRYIESFLNKDIYKSIELCIRKPGISLQALENLYKEKGLNIIRVDLSEDRSGHTSTCLYMLNGRSEKAFQKAYQELVSLEDIQSIKLTGRTLE